MLDKLKMKNRKGTLGLGDIYPAVLTFVLVGIVLGIGLYVLAEVEYEVTAVQASTAINSTISALASFATWFSIIIIVLAAAIIIGLVVRSFRQ